MRAFAPGATVSLAVSAVSQRVRLGEYATPTQVRVVNDGTATVWLAFGDATVTAAAASGLPVPAGTVEVLSIPTGAIAGPVHVAAIAAAASGTVYFTNGVGF